MGGRTKVTTPVTAAVTTKTVLDQKEWGAGKPHSKERKPEGANFAQIVRAELKKALRKKSGKRKKRRANDSKATATPTKVLEGVGRIALGNYILVRNVN
eukprot:CCRYP_002282-RA/>CCRYP_002282-RA protein AED:0.47 eAED:0.47 QI:0/-1/0/1/-1/1/1/0/98